MLGHDLWGVETRRGSIPPLRRMHLRGPHPEARGGLAKLGTRGGCGPPQTRPVCPHAEDAAGPGTSRSGWWSRRHATPFSPALLAGSGPCGGAAEACQEGSGFRCRGESGWCRDMTSTHGAWRHAGVRFLLSGECICFDTTLWPALGLPSMAPMAGRGPPRTRPARPHADDAAGPVVSGTPCAKEARPPTLHGRGRGAGACFPLARIVATSRREGWSGRRAAPSSPALLAVSGPRGGAAKACRGGSGFRCRGESGWCSDMTSTHGP